ncbi:MAG: N-6 DNA methylase, partial [Gemmatimonadaceae bacterium]
MHTLASAAALLNRITGIESAPPLLAGLGFAADLVSLDSAALHRLGISSEEFGSPHIVQGTGSLRALVFTSHGGTSLRSTVTRAAARLSQTTPHLLWLIVAIADTNELAIATWDPGVDSPKIAALVARRGEIVDSDAETLCTLSASITRSDIATHRRWLRILGRQSVTRRFFRCLQHSVRELAACLSPAPPPRDAADLALVYTSRLLFLSFLETKGWLDRDHAFLTNRYADCMLKGGRYHHTVLAPLFFGTLNTHPRNRAPRAVSFGRIPFLNGGLFARSRLEHDLRQSCFTDETIGDLFDNLLTRYRFTAREDNTAWSEAAIDPEMLGKSFESLMASSDRKTTGAFYTPQPLVDQLTTSGLVRALSSQDATSDTIGRALAGEIPSPLTRTAIIEKVGKIRLLDPACGSGAFLVHSLETLSSLCTRLGDVRPLHTIRRSILTSSIFGVDINPTAVWLCELRLWLSMAIEDPERDPLRVRPLPNLDRHIRVGDSLAGSGFNDGDKMLDARRVTKARERYARATGPRKRNLARTLDRAERASAAESIAETIRSLTRTRRDLVSSVRSRDLFGERRLNPAGLVASLAATRMAIKEARRSAKTLARGAALPFSFQTHFADVGASGGFDLVIGNPPWVRTHKLEPAVRARFRQEFWVFRHSAWKTGARSAAATNGFASQVDLAALFVERSVRLTRPCGTVALLVPAKLWRSLAGGGLRSYLLSQTRLAELHDLTESRQLFEAAVYPSLVVACRDREAEPRARTDTSTELPNDLRVVVHRADSVVQWNANSGCLAFDRSPGSPWLLLPAEVRLACDRLTTAGRP